MKPIFRYFLLLTACLFSALAFPQGENQKGTAKTPPKAIVAEVAKFAKDLGADSFKIRRKATKRLLAIANTETKNEDKSGEKIVRPYEGYVWEEMKKLSAHKDPEIAQRAKEIYETLFPSIDVSKMGKLKFTIRSGDTIKSIAKIFESKPEWIKAANPGLRSDKDLPNFSLVNVPIPKGSEWSDSIGEEIEIEEEILNLVEEEW